MQIVNLQIAPTSVKPVVHVSQSDVGRQFQLRLFDGAVAYSLPSGTTARFDGIKPDKEGFSYSDATSVSGNTITVTTKTQMTTTPGNVECEIRLVNNSQDIGTLNFIMLVEESPLSDVDISKTDLPDLIAEVRAAADTAVASATSASNSAESASGSATSATTAATSASTNGLKAEGYAVGKQNGADVPSGSQYYHNNAAYYANIASSLSSNPPYIGANGNWYVWNTSTSQYVDSGIDASITVAIADITMLAPNATPYVTNTGTDTDPIFHLFIPRGSGITSVTKTGTSGLVDTYTIAYSDGSTTTFTVTNGKSAYDAAVDGGYDGTEAEFNADLAQFKTLAQSANTSASNASSSALSASNSATSASNKALDSEAWANGQRNGVDVPSTDPAYQNNAKYYKDQISGALAEIQTLTNNLADEVSARAELGAHNILKFPNELSDNGYEYSGDTGKVTAYGECGFKINGTFPSFVAVYITPRETTDAKYLFYLKKGSYRVKLFDSNFINQTFGDLTVGARVYTTYNGASNRVASSDASAKTLEFTIDENTPCDYITSDGRYLIGVALMPSATPYNNLVVYPLLELASDNDMSYQPYAMTNVELTEVAQQEIGNYVFLGTKSLSVTADGVKTIQTLLNDLKLSFDSYLESNSDIYAYPKGVNLNTTRLAVSSTAAVDGVFHNTTHGTVACSDVSISSTTYSLAYCKLHTTLSSCLYCLCENGTITVKNTDVLTSGDQIRLYFEQYKIIE